MTNWKLTLAYDGTPFHGWQIQPSLPTIQGTLAEAIRHITGEQVLPQGSGRTDTGVHALAQVASVCLGAPIPPENLLRALNRCLPPSIRILAAEHASSTFHARHSALGKTYEYRIFPLKPTVTGDSDRICPPTLAPYVWPCPWPLGCDSLNQAAAQIIGTHDFTSFAAADPDQSGTTPPPIRTIHLSHWQQRDDLLVYTVTGSGFLHHMVRNLVGTFVQPSLRSPAHAPDGISRLIAARNRSLAGPTAPPQGLFLVSVEYPDTLSLAAEPQP